MWKIYRALRDLEATIYKRADGDPNYLVDKFTLDILRTSDQPSYTLQTLRRLKVSLSDMKRLVKRRWVNIKRDVEGNFSFEISSLGQKV